MAVDKLVDSTLLDAACTYEAGKIREKLGSSAQIAYDLANGKGFGDAIAAIPTGGGGLGGLANLADVTEENYLYGYMMSCIKNGDTAGGTIIQTSTFPGSEVLLISTGLTIVHGLILAATSLGRTALGAGNSNLFAVFINYDTVNYPTCGYDAWGMSQNLVRSQQSGTYGTQNANGPTNGTLRLDGGDVYYTARYNNNNNYQIIRSGIEYDWLAW